MKRNRFSYAGFPVPVLGGMGHSMNEIATKPSVILANLEFPPAGVSFF